MHAPSKLTYLRSFHLSIPRRKVSQMALPSSATEWTESHVKQWLTQCGFGSYAHLMCDIHKINGTALLMLSEKDLRSPPLSIEVIFSSFFLLREM